jgi:hypothetical protein
MALRIGELEFRSLFTLPCTQLRAMLICVPVMCWEDTPAIGKQADDDDDDGVLSLVVS